MFTSDDYPLFFYLFNKEGEYGNPIRINNMEELKNTFKSLSVRIHFWTGLEIRITDTGDFCVFHAKDKKVIFPAGDRLEIIFFGNEISGD